MVFESNTISLAKVMDGEQGKTQYIHIMYSNKENPTSSSDISKTPNDYMGVCISTSATAPLSPTEYTWSKIKGEVGEQGIKGDDGKTYYLHVKWSNDGGKTICEGTGAWMGVYTDTSPDALELPEAYQWTRIIGTDGTAIILTNESHTIPCDQNGLNGNYTGAETEVLIFEGSKNTTSTWKITCSPSKEIVGSFKNNKYTITKITGQSGYVDFTAIKDGYSSLSKRFQISTSKTGADAVINWLLCNKTVLHRDNIGKIKDNEIIITSKQQIGNQTSQSYSGRFKIYFDDVVNYTSTTDESAKTITVPDSINAIKVELYSSGDSNLLLDQQTITVVDDGQRGSNGKSYQLSIINPVNTIVYDYTGNNPIPSSTGAFSAELYEDGNLITSGITYQWSTKSKGSVFSGTSAASTFSPTLSKTYTGQSNNSICLIATYNGQSLYAVSDIIVVKNAKPGVSAINMILSNDSHNIPVVNGTKIYSGAETTVSIYEGTNDVTSGWTIKTELNGITGTFKDNKFTVTALDKDTGYVDFTASKSGYTDVTKRFSLSVSKEGNDGVSYRLSLDNTIIYKKNDGTLSINNIVMTGYRQIGSNDIVTYGCRYEVYADDQLSYKSTTDEFSHTFKLTSAMKKLQIKMYKSGGLITLLDEQTVYVLSDGASGADGYTIYLTNQNETFLSDTNGNIPSDIQSVAKVVAYKGTEKVALKIGTIPDIPGLSHTVLNDTITFVAVSGTSLADKGSVEIPVLIEDKSFIVVYSWIKLANASSDLTSLRTAVNEVKNTTDTLKGEITECVKQTVYDKDQKAIESKFSSTTTTLEGITSEVSSMRTDFGNKIDSNSTKIQQTSDRINLIATGDKESNLEITDGFISLASEKIGIKAMNVNIDALTTFMNTAKDGTTTVISGGAIKTDTVNAMLIAAQLLQSKNYQGSSIVNGIYAQAGLQINMETGAMTAKNFAIDDKGNAYFKGNGEFEGSITANKGYIGGIGGFTIEAGKLYSGMDTFPEQPTLISKDKNVYIGTDGIALGSGNFRVDSNGKLYANSGTFSGTIYADGGTIGGWQISANSLSNRDGSISLNPDGLKLGNQLNVDNQGNATFGGKLSAATGSFSGELVAATGSFSGELKAATGTFSGNLKAATGSFKGELSGATGSFTGSVIATSITAKQSYSIYYNDVGTGEPTDSVQVITAFDWGTNTTQIGFGLIDSSLDSSKMHGMLLIKEQGARVLTLIADDINTNGWLNVNKLNITDSLGQYKGVPYKSIMWKPTDTFDFNGYNHHHTILPYKNGNFAVGMESTTTGMLSISLLPYLLSTEADAYGNITVSKTKDTTSQISIGATANPYACIYVDAIYLTGDKKTYTSLANLGNGGTTNYNGLTNKPKINNVELASGNNTLSDLGIAARSHSHSSSDINWSTTLGYKGFGHNHTMIYDGQGLKGISVAGSESPSNMGLIPYNVTYTNADSISLTRGGTMYLGAAYYSNKLTAYPFECGYFKNIKVYKGSGDASDISNYITPSGGSSGRGIASITSGGTSANGLKITFNSNCQTEGTNLDWVQIFYESNGRKIALSKLGGSFGGTIVSIPATTFWLYWRTDVSVDSFYGFSIDSITPANVSSPSLSTTSDSFPGYSVTELSGSNYPESSHGSYGNNINQLWRYTYSGGGTGSYKITLEDGTVYTLNTSPTVNQATSSTAGIMKLYSSTGSNTDGTMTQAAIKAAIDAIDTSGGGYTAGVGIKIVNNQISLTGTSKDNYRYVRNPIDGTLHMSNGCGWDLVNTDNKEVTGIYCNGSNEVIISEKDYDTILRGSSIQLGNSNTIVKIPYLPNYTSASKYLVDDGNGNIGWKTISSSGGGSSITGGLTIKLDGTPQISSWKGASDASVNITASSIGAATTSWVKREFGSKIDVSNGYLYLYNNNGSQLSSVQLPTSSGGGSSSTNMLEYGSYSSEWVLTSDSKSTYLVFRPSYVGSYKAYLGDGSHLWQKLNCQASPQVYSDRNVKDDIKYLSEYQLNLDKFFFDLKPVSYHLKTDTDNNDHHYGLIAQDVEESFIKNHIEDYASYGILSKIKLSKPNVVGLTEQYMLSYEEFIPINIMMTQKAHHRIDSLESENQSLKNEILMLQGQLSLITQRLQKMEEKLC